MNNIRSAARLVSGVRQIRTSPRVFSEYDNSHLKKLKEDQAKFQKDDNLPVHFKGGVTDKILYYLTFGLMGYGMIEGGRFMYVCYTD